MDYIEAGIFSDDSDEEEGEGMEEDEDGGAPSATFSPWVMVHAA